MATQEEDDALIDEFEFDNSEDEYADAAEMPHEDDNKADEMFLNLKTSDLDAEFEKIKDQEKADKLYKNLKESDLKAEFKKINDKEDDAQIQEDFDALQGEFTGGRKRHRKSKRINPKGKKLKRNKSKRRKSVKSKRIKKRKEKYTRRR